MPSLNESTAIRAIKAFFTELIRRRVLYIGCVYLAGAWVGTEIVSYLLEQFNAPSWSFHFLAIVFTAGFFVTMVLAWIIQVQKDGSLKIDPTRGKRNTAAVAIILGLLITIGLSSLIIPEMDSEPAYKPLPNSLAVLPFTVSASHSSEKPASARLYRSVMTGLEQSPGIALVRLIRGERAADLSAYGKSLNVAILAAGQITHSGKSLNIQMLLLDVKLEEVFWSRSYRWDKGHVIETAIVLANDMLQAMTLPVLTRNQFMGTDVRDAYEAFITGEVHAATRSPDLYMMAVEEYQRALDMDPAYTQAYLGLAQAIYDLVEISNLPNEEEWALRARARVAVDIAQQLDHESADAISLLGLHTENRHLRIQAFERALELDPDHFLSYYRYAMVMKEDGNLDEAERLIKRAIMLNPMSTPYRAELAAIGLLQKKSEDTQTNQEYLQALQQDQDRD